MNESSESDLKPATDTVGVKFSDGIFLLQSFLDKFKIHYDESNLEKTPFGLAHRVEKEDDEDMV
jgi:hypothetical protein